MKQTRKQLTNRKMKKYLAEKLTKKKNYQEVSIAYLPNTGPTTEDDFQLFNFRSNLVRKHRATDC